MILLCAFMLSQMWWNISTNQTRYIAEKILTANIPFDERFQCLLAVMVQGLGVMFPPTHVPDADRLYIRLQVDVHAMLG